MSYHDVLQGFLRVTGRPIMWLTMTTNLHASLTDYPPLTCQYAHHFKQSCPEHMGCAVHTAHTSARHIATQTLTEAHYKESNFTSVPACEGLRRQHSRFTGQSQIVLASTEMEQLGGEDAGVLLPGELQCGK